MPYLTPTVKHSQYCKELFKNYRLSLPRVGMIPDVKLTNHAMVCIYTSISPSSFRLQTAWGGVVPNWVLTFKKPCSLPADGNNVESEYCTVIPALLPASHCEKDYTLSIL